MQEQERDDFDATSRRWASDASLIDIPADPTPPHDHDHDIQRLHPNCLHEDDDITDTPKPRLTARRTFVNLLHHERSQTLPTELWLEILLRTRHPRNLVMTCRTMHEMANSTTTMARYIMHNYPHRPLKALLNWRFFAGPVDDNHAGMIAGVGWYWDEIAPCRNCSMAKRTVTGNVILSRPSRLRILFRVGWRVVAEVVNNVTQRIVQSARRDRFSSVRCPRERRQLAIVRALIEFGLLERCGPGGDKLIMFAADRSHLSLLSFLIDMCIGRDSAGGRHRKAFDEITVLGSDTGDDPDVGTSGEAQEQEAEEQTPAWMMDGKLLEQAVRRRDLRLVTLLCSRGAAVPAANGTRAFAIASLRKYIPELLIMQEYGAVAPESLLIVTVRRALTARLFSFRICEGCCTRREPTLTTVVHIVMRSLKMTQEDFRESAAGYLTASLTELGSPSLMRTAMGLGADFTIGESSALFYSVLMGHHRLARYLIREAGIPVRPMFLFRRVAGITMLILLITAVMTWFIVNVFIMIVALYCWVSCGLHGTSRTAIVIVDGACASITGTTYIDGEFWVRTNGIVVILGATVGLTQRTMPLHGVVLGSYEVLRAWWLGGAIA